MENSIIPLDTVLNQWSEGGLIEDFQPCARYYEAMDVVIYLKEDVSYRADRVDRFLTLLWHPTEDRAIGVKLKGWRHLFETIRRISDSLGKRIQDEQFVPLMAGVEIALATGMGKKMTEDAERARKYNEARMIVSGVKFDAREVACVAA